MQSQSFFHLQTLPLRPAALWINFGPRFWYFTWHINCRLDERRRLEMVIFQLETQIVSSMQLLQKSISSALCLQLQTCRLLLQRL